MVEPRLRYPNRPPAMDGRRREFQQASDGSRAAAVVYDPVDFGLHWVMMR